MSIDVCVSCDGPLGIEFLSMRTKGKGVVLTVERIIEAFAEAKGYKPEECELIQVVDEISGRLIWGDPRFDDLGVAES